MTSIPTGRDSEATAERIRLERGYLLECLGLAFAFILVIALLAVMSMAVAGVFAP